MRLSWRRRQEIKLPFLFEYIRDHPYAKLEALSRKKNQAVCFQIGRKWTGKGWTGFRNTFTYFKDLNVENFGEGNVKSADINNLIEKIDEKYKLSDKE
jgi:hypothetical protein